MAEENRYETPATPIAATGPATAAPGIPPPVTPATATGPIVVLEKKSPGLAGVLSGIFPGLGQVYLGLYQRAFKIAGVFIGCIFFVSSEFFGGRMAPLFGLGIAFTWFFGIIDAVRQAKAINAGFVDAGNLAESERAAIRRAPEGTASLTWGVVLVGLGTLWLLDRYADLDAFWELVEDWLVPVSFILLGLILITTYVIKKRRRNESEVWPPRE
jgi:hypothetical protein